MHLEDSGFLILDGKRIEYRFLGPQPGEAPTIVMLHEGLGCVGMWGDFPERLQKATRCGVFVYSRFGYGQSSPCALPRPLDYMNDEANRVLPALLDMIGFRHGLLLGHSDGASISAIYAGSHQDHRIGGIVLIAPHFFTEDVSITSIAEAKKAYDAGDLRPRLAKWHADVDCAFRGWNDAWLDPGFRKWDITERLAFIRVPILIVQGEDDQYGTVKQLEVAEQECYCPVETALIKGAKHTPQREQLEVTLKTIADFVAHVLEIEK